MVGHGSRWLGASTLGLTGQCAALAAAHPPLHILVLAGFPGVFLLAKTRLAKHLRMSLFRPTFIRSPGRAYSRGLGESVTRSDRRRRELGLGSRRRRSPAHENRRRDSVIFLSKIRATSRKEQELPMKKPQEIPEEAKLSTNYQQCTVCR